MHQQPTNPATDQPRRIAWRWALVLSIATAVLIAGPPNGITPQSWRLLAIFLATIIASIVRPAPMGAVVFIAVCVLAITGTMTPTDALKGYADPSSGWCSRRSSSRAR